MSLFDKLKKQVAAAAGAPASHSSGENKSYTVTLSSLPVTLEQMKAMPEAVLTEPQFAAALAICAYCLYPVDKDAALEMLEFLQGPRGMSGLDKQFLADRFKDSDYVARSYFAGATPQNNYEPAEPYTLTFFENPYSRANYNEGYLTLYINSGGADSARSVKLRLKPSTGQWFLWEQFLLVGIRTPVSADPWA